MQLTSKTIGIVIALATVVSVIAALPFLIKLANSPTTNPTTTTPTTTTINENIINFTLLDNAGVMIEAAGMRIYVDPINLGDAHNDLPADVILITHPHADHHQSYTIRKIRADDTTIVFPANMSDPVIGYDAIGVVPRDQIHIGCINITAFYMYTWAPEGYEPSHPPEANWTSYIIDIDGFTFFHAGDSKNITEYERLTGHVDVALLPIGPGCQTMVDDEVVDAIQTIQPRYFIPIHYGPNANGAFVLEYGDDIEDTTDCEILNLDYFTSYIFELE
jgi:L-ascorbate metabolism protein UlaG (beta-lactamase superfamily)